MANPGPAGRIGESSAWQDETGIVCDIESAAVDWMRSCASRDIRQMRHLGCAKEETPAEAR